MSEFKCPNFIEAGILWLAFQIETSVWNDTQEIYRAPTANNGGECRTSVFEMRAYCWSEDTPRAYLPNFKCGDFEVSWYKYLGRGMTMNKDISANEFAEMIDKCLESVRNETVEVI